LLASFTEFDDAKVREEKQRIFDVNQKAKIEGDFMVLIFCGDSI